MTSDSAAFVLRFFELLEADDFDGLSAQLDPEVVLLGTRGGLEGQRIVRGRVRPRLSGLLRSLAAFLRPTGPLAL